MNKPKFWMMVGLPGSGKSYKAKELADEHDANIHSSDAIREELLGDINAQDANGVVFTTLHNRVKEDLRNGKSCIYDATNISYKRRMAFLQEFKNIPCEKICFLMATPYEQCLKNNAARDRSVPEYVIERMYRQFDVPWEYEGCDKIYVEYFDGSEDSFGAAKRWLDDQMNYNQENSHHTLTLGEHCLKAVEYVDNHASEYDGVNFDIVRRATMIHDCGKQFCKTFINGKGAITEQAHYYSHEHTGSYDSLFYDTNGDNLYIAVLIRWHMQVYYWEKDNNEKLHNKYLRLWGEELYNDIMTLHEADKAAH